MKGADWNPESKRPVGSDRRISDASALDSSDLLPDQQRAGGSAFRDTEKRGLKRTRALGPRTPGVWDGDDEDESEGDAEEGTNPSR